MHRWQNSQNGNLLGEYTRRECTGGNERGCVTHAIERIMCLAVSYLRMKLKRSAWREKRKGSMREVCAMPTAKNITRQEIFGSIDYLIEFFEQLGITTNVFNICMTFFMAAILTTGVMSSDLLTCPGNHSDRIAHI